MKALVGNYDDPIYSCSLLKITGGDKDLDCDRSDLDDPSCTKAGANLASLRKESKAGKFCYKKKSTGEIDSEISEKPINVACDPRVGCDGIAVAPFLCKADITSQILSPTEYPHAICADAINNFADLNTEDAPYAVPTPQVTESIVEMTTYRTYDAPIQTVESTNIEETATYDAPYAVPTSAASEIEDTAYTYSVETTEEHKVIIEESSIPVPSLTFDIP
jgi:hypothetical protein